MRKFLTLLHTHTVLLLLYLLLIGELRGDETTAQQKLQYFFEWSKSVLLRSFICTFDIYNLALFYPNNFVKLTRISIKVMKDLWYFGHLHLKTDEKWTFFTISRPILLSSFTYGDMVNILSFPCRVLQTTKDKSSYFQQHKNFASFSFQKTQ